MGQSGIEDPPVVLLVEDEPLVRTTAADELEEAGFHVLEAANADVALAVLEARSYNKLDPGRHCSESNSFCSALGG